MLSPFIPIQRVICREALTTGEDCRYLSIGHVGSILHQISVSLLLIALILGKVHIPVSSRVLELLAMQNRARLGDDIFR
jgi:hypothetical protein